MNYRTAPEITAKMPTGVPYIIGNEAAERFSFYGMKAILAIFLTQYLHLMDGDGGHAMDKAYSTELIHWFNVAFYITPIIGAVLADIFFGKYLVIMILSLIYCLGHAALAMMGVFGHAEHWMLAGMILIALGAGGIKPCVSAHVGDQFSHANHYLLTRVYNWFYFSINIGALTSMLLTPWLLEWYGPHWAFGVPGGLMAMATFVFWLGRKRFVHIPAGGLKFFREVFSKEGIFVLLKLIPVYLFVAIFWALFDQTGSTWIFQAQDMDRHFLGFEWLPSQIQSVNSVFVLTFIPLFSYFVYPVVQRFIPLTPLRKMGSGFVLMAMSFALVALIQENIESGGRPPIYLQLIAYALLTAAEVLISIVALEFAYTQSPKKMKSFVMCYFLAAVALGNFFVAVVNKAIRIPSAADQQLELAISNLPADWQDSPRSVVLPGYDKNDPNEFFVRRLDRTGEKSLEIPGQAHFQKIAQEIQTVGFQNIKTITDLDSDSKDYWGRDMKYEMRSASEVAVISSGGDAKFGTKWDIGVIIKKAAPESKNNGWLSFLQPEQTWLERKQQQSTIGEERGTYSVTYFSGGQQRLQGAVYFWFFTALMGITAVLFIPFAMIYRPKNYL